ncbi:Oidioi.mRNA.OKI2018_I69.PAR.g11820.t1.cds [Oikopleura dioica]|uniref:Oidioi.mRNA.OKI2018_I69.PAR.g11820.t1.cds n=1 Tax=Oikopleura dioica TaxID=34765 RepID=A0ABN7S488_OIKDI|nr:Oidioi.mRNA.OKI2018_I69.PAR.g11820.t1.cds [Oikopleura dioica]
MKGLSKNLGVTESYVACFGSIGKCSSCELVTKSTANIKGNRYCVCCASKKFPEESKKAKFEKTDAKFKCYAGRSKGCGADQLNYREFYVGTCCENAALRADDYRYETLKIVNEIFEETRDEEGIVEKRVEDAEKQVESSRKVMEVDQKLVEEVLKKAQESSQAFEEAKVDAEKCKEELAKIRKWRKKVQKRSLVLSKAAMKEDNSDAESSGESDEPETKKSKGGEENNEDDNCKICCEVFSEAHPLAALTACGHIACFNCLSNLPQKTCPTCRKKFTKRNILKLFK